MSTVLDNYIRTGNIGTDLIVQMTELVGQTETAIDLTTFSISSLAIEVRKPRGTVLTLSATNVTDGTDGRIHHVDSAGIFDRRGRWQIRGVMNITGGNVFKGSWKGFQVGD